LKKDENIIFIEDKKVPREDYRPDEEHDPTKPEYYTYTDGCGNISLALCNLINKKFDLIRCSAYQVRLGGAKGILMFKRYTGSEVKKNRELLVELRPSMMKFKTEEFPLEVIRCATFS
jgi:RNA dependent RNA polymerase